MSDCIFCRIVAGEIPAAKLYEDQDCIAFRDIQPAAPVHVLVIPREHLKSLGEAEEKHKGLLGHLSVVASQIAATETGDKGFRVVINTGDDGGQTVGHLHLHVLAGRHMTWPPG